MENGFKNLENLNARSGFLFLITIPKIKGIPKINETNFTNSKGSNCTVLNIWAVGSYKFPQNAKLIGVIKTATNVAKAVRLTDKAAFPPESCVMKFEILPPGQAATIIIPKAILGMGFIMFTNKKVIKGNKMN